MRFGEVALEEAEGGILAHTHRLSGLSSQERTSVLKKGRILSASDLSLLKRHGFDRVWVALLDTDDVDENRAAAALARCVAGNFVTTTTASTGRVNCYAETQGLLCIDAQGIDAVNLADARLTIATIPPLSRTHPGQLVATIKIIPFAVSKTDLNRSIEAAGGSSASLVHITPFTSKRVALIQSVLPGVARSQLDRSYAAQEQRIRTLGSHLQWRIQVPHTQAEMARAIELVLQEEAELVMLLGASAMVDVGDVLPQAIVLAGGELLQVGMPVDPGNLLVLAQHKSIPIIGIPGCARSTKRSGFDIVLERWAANYPIDSTDIRKMGVGGLLEETQNRPQPEQHTSNIAAVVLAAGKSSRMGLRNKLLEPLDGVPILIRTLNALIESPIVEIIVVLGHESQELRATLCEQPVETIENPDYHQGMASSLRVGIKALSSNLDGALVVLGDMPFVTQAHINSLLNAYSEARRPDGIFVPVHSGQRGHPVLFGVCYFEQLQSLEGDVGARSILRENPNKIIEVRMDDDATVLDIDDEVALKNLARRFDLTTSR